VLLVSRNTLEAEDGWEQASYLLGGRSQTEPASQDMLRTLAYMKHFCVRYSYYTFTAGTYD